MNPRPDIEIFEAHISGENPHLGLSFYLRQLPGSVQNSFKEWYLSKLVSFKSNFGFDIKNSATEDELNKIEQTVKIEAGRCYQNSQAIVLSFPQYQLFEGFYDAAKKDEFYPYCTYKTTRHAFNVLDSEVKDFTSIKGNLINRFYFGIDIPNSFVQKYLNEKCNGAPSDISLVVPFFCEETNCEDLKYHQAYNGIDYESGNKMYF